MNSVGGDRNASLDEADLRMIWVSVNPSNRPDETLVFPKWMAMIPTTERALASTLLESGGTLVR